MLFFQGSSTCDKLSSVSASMVVPRGVIKSEWSCGSPDLCGTAAESSSVTLKCISGVIKSIDFASFGTPEGTCASGFNISSCNSPNSMNVVSNACVGKASCTVEASNDVFGGDPCYNVLKHLSVIASGCDSSLLFSQSASIPVGSTTTVVSPTFGATNVTVCNDNEEGHPFQIISTMPFISHTTVH
eukprot:m.73715 g.73715  ORF g.73715 m.73715 type:complete len:186 (-) comp11778_c1_seq8:2072-2629(-)